MCAAGLARPCACADQRREGCGNAGTSQAQRRVRRGGQKASDRIHVQGRRRYQVQPERWRELLEQVFGGDQRTSCQDGQTCRRVPAVHDQRHVLRLHDGVCDAEEAAPAAPKEKSGAPREFKENSADAGTDHVIAIRAGGTSHSDGHFDRLYDSANDPARQAEKAAAAFREHNGTPG